MSGFGHLLTEVQLKPDTTTGSLKPEAWSPTPDAWTWSDLSDFAGPGQRHHHGVHSARRGTKTVQPGGVHRNPACPPR